jgi:hypothetical protein
MLRSVKSGTLTAAGWKMLRTVKFGLPAVLMLAAAVEQAHADQILKTYSEEAQL